MQGTFGICWEEWAAHLAGLTAQFREAERLLRLAEAAETLKTMARARGREESRSDSPRFRGAVCDSPSTTSAARIGGRRHCRPMRAPAPLFAGPFNRAVDRPRQSTADFVNDARQPAGSNRVHLASRTRRV